MSNKYGFEDELGEPTDSEMVDIIAQAELRGAAKIAKTVKDCAALAETMWQIETNPDHRAELRGRYMALAELTGAIDKHLSLKEIK